MESIVRKYRKGNLAVKMAYTPSKNLTMIGTQVPHVVPLYADFDVTKSMGSVRLVETDQGVYGMYDVSLPVKMRFRELLRTGEIPEIVLAIDGEEKFIHNGINYIRGGIVTGATLHDRIPPKQPEVRPRGTHFGGFNIGLLNDTFNPGGNE